MLSRNSVFKYLPLANSSSVTFGGPEWQRSVCVYPSLCTASLQSLPKAKGFH